MRSQQGRNASTFVRCHTTPKLYESLYSSRNLLYTLATDFCILALFMPSFGCNLYDHTVLDFCTFGPTYLVKYKAFFLYNIKVSSSLSIVCRYKKNVKKNLHHKSYTQCLKNCSLMLQWEKREVLFVNGLFMDGDTLRALRVARVHSRDKQIWFVFIAQLGASSCQVH